jgi:hypothetical protein
MKQNLKLISNTEFVQYIFVNNEKFEALFGYKMSKDLKNENTGKYIFFGNILNAQTNILSNS